MHIERIQSIKAVARSTAIGGTFQASLRPVDVLPMVRRTNRAECVPSWFLLDRINRIDKILKPTKKQYL